MPPHFVTPLKRSPGDNTLLRVAMSREELDALRWVARRAGVTLSDWIRSISQTAIRQQAHELSESRKFENPESRKETKLRSDNPRPVPQSTESLRQRHGEPDRKAQAKKREWAKKQLRKEQASSGMSNGK